MWKWALLIAVLVASATLWIWAPLRGPVRAGKRLDAPQVTKPGATFLIPVLLDTDIGTDIDDAFALALVMRSPELELLGVTTVSGNTEARARLAAKLLWESGFQFVPVAGLPDAHGFRGPRADHRLDARPQIGVAADHRGELSLRRLRRRAAERCVRERDATCPRTHQPSTSSKTRLSNVPGKSRWWPSAP